MVDKKIFRLTNVELYDLMMNGSGRFSFQDLTVEMASRKLTVQQIDNLEDDHYQHKKLQQERSHQLLTTEEYLTLFIFPFFTPKPRWRNDHLSQSEFERYKMYGFDKKLEQAKSAKRFGILFWFLFFIVVFLMYSFFSR